jgi:hypothetical protein
MGFSYIPLIFIGLAITAWALPASYRISSPWRILAALAALAGVIVSLFGVLLFSVPKFFS